MNNIENRKPYVKTIVDEEYKTETIEYFNNLFERTMKIDIQGQTVDRSFEDRDVYLSIDHEGKNITNWLRGEQAIELGTKLIVHGKKALIANMINHQLSRCDNRLMKFIDESRVKKIILKCIDEKPKNYGGGYKTFRVIPIWIKDKAPEYNEDFCYDVVIYFSPFEDEFKQQIERFKVNVEFVDYDHEKEVKEFNERCKQME